MLQDKDIVSVINRNSGFSSYPIPDSGMNLWREFAPGETKKIEAGELRKVMHIPGGDAMLRDYLVILNQELVDEILGDVQPEYYYTNAEIKELLLNGTLNQLDDCLTFAPDGVIDIVKQIAVDVKLNDMNKRELIYEKTGYNVNNVITNNKLVEKAETEMGLKEKSEAKVRKAEIPVQSVKEQAGPQRKAETPKYKVVTQVK